MKGSRPFLIAVGLGLVLLLFVVLFAAARLTPVLALPTQGETVADVLDARRPATAPRLSASTVTGQPALSRVGLPADDHALAPTMLESTCPITMTGPIWWDTPPQSGSVLTLPSGEQIIQPGPEDEVRVIIQLEDEPVAAFKSRLRDAPVRVASTEPERIRAYADELRESHRRLLSQIESQGIKLELAHEYDYLFNGLAVSIKMGEMARIEALPAVRAVHPDYQICALLNDSVPLIGASQVWTIRDASGQLVTGRGIRVAVIDSGIDYTHLDLGGGFGLGHKVAGGWDFVNSDADPMDDRGHGTHVAGIVAANGVVKGVAPEATLYAYKVISAGG